jgi:protein-S-isoprenylcysteine O-methyltransferase Ste14
MTEKGVEKDKLDQPYPVWFILIVPIYCALAFSLLIFLPAGDWTWLEGWISVLSLALTIGIGTAIVNQQNPRVLRNRSRLKKQGLTKDTEKPAASDRFIMPLLGIGGFGALVLSALGHRFGWYAMPFGVAIFGAVLMNLGAVIMLVAQNQNAHASKILDISKGQVLVDTGLYGLIRHPLYAGYCLLILFFPIALGSVWGLPLALLSCASILIRIHYEEEMLLKGMEGYQDYQSRVNYKLIPGIY